MLLVALCSAVLAQQQQAGALLAATAHCALVRNSGGSQQPKRQPVRCVAAHYPPSSSPPAGAAWDTEAPAFSPSADPHGCDAYATAELAAAGLLARGDRHFAAIVRRGGCSFEQKARAAEASGALSLLIVDSSAEPGAPGLGNGGGGGGGGPGLGEDEQPPVVPPVGIPVAMVGAAEGESLLASLAAAAGAAQEKEEKEEEEEDGGGGALRLAVRFEVGGSAAAGAAEAALLLRSERRKLHGHCLARGESSYDCATLHRTLQEQLLAGTDAAATEAAEAEAAVGAAAAEGAGAEAGAGAAGAAGAACSAAQRAAQLSYFGRASALDSVEFNGEDEKLDTLLMLLHRLAPEPAGFVALDVGCARGDFSWAVQVLWNMHGVRVYDEIVRQPSPPHVFGAGLAVSHCFEPVPETFEVLRRAAAGGDGGGGEGYDAAPYSESAARAALFAPSGSTRIHNLALSNASGAAVTMFTTSDVADSVVSSFYRGADPALDKAVAVNVTTVDAFCFSDGFGTEAAGALARVDILKIDTEGADPLVLAGAARMLREGRVGVVFWEYGHVWTVAVDTGVHNLESTVASLDAHGYDSYLLGRERAIKLNGNCWARQYEFWWWSNIVSIRRDWPHREQLIELYGVLPWLGHSSREIRGK